MLADETQRELSHIDGIVVESDANRIYPYDAVGSKVVGFVSRENAGLSGVELAYDHELRGTPGRATILRNGRYSTDRYYEYVDKKPDRRQARLSHHRRHRAGHRRDRVAPRRGRIRRQGRRRHHHGSGDG
jgi:hypothetical protein